jgi:hypothetical protein
MLSKPREKVIGKAGKVNHQDSSEKSEVELVVDNGDRNETTKAVEEDLMPSRASLASRETLSKELLYEYVLHLTNFHLVRFKHPEKITDNILDKIHEIETSGVYDYEKSEIYTDEKNKPIHGKYHEEWKEAKEKGPPEKYEAYRRLLQKGMWSGILPYQRCQGG